MSSMMALKALAFTFVSLFVLQVVGASTSITSNDNLRLESFSWSDCSDDHKSALIHTISVTPDPITVPGNVSVGFAFSAFTNLTSPSPFTMRVYKKEAFFWLPLPCTDDQGSCDYPDFCTRWPIPSPCPETYATHGIPCTCPFLQGEYNLPNSFVGHITHIGPKWLDSGDFRIKAWVDDKAGNQLFCIQLNLSMKT